MAALDLTTILNTAGVQMVAGQLLIYHEDHHLELGSVTRAGIDLTPEGEAFFEQLQAVPIAAAAAEVAAVLADAAATQAAEDAAAAALAAKTAAAGSVEVTGPEPTPPDAATQIQDVAAAAQAALDEALGN